MTIEKMFPSGGLLITDIVGGEFVKMRYFDYTVEEAIELFRQELKERGLEDDGEVVYLNNRKDV